MLPAFTLTHLPVLVAAQPAPDSPYLSYHPPFHGQPPSPLSVMPYYSCLPSLDSSASTRSSSSAGDPCDLSAMSEDGLKAFAYLQTSAPRWLSDIAGLEHSIESKQKEMAKSYQERPQLQRNNSVTSIREDVVSDGTEPSEASPPKDKDTTNGSPRQSARRPNLLTKRLRVLSSGPSSVASGTPKFRTRSMAIVYYDAEIQKAFEKLVREISMGRNQIRKGRMAARMSALTSDLDDATIQQSGTADAELETPDLPQFRRAGERASATNGQSDDRLSAVTLAYDKADKALEKAQSLCEKAAHQFLRDGDCRLETEGTKEAFHELLDLSKEELPRLQALERAEDRTATFSPPPLEKSSSPEERPTTGLTLASIEVDDSDEQGPSLLPELLMLPRRSQRRSPA